MYPKMRRWVRQCVACQRQGIDPAMPDEARGSRNLRMYFADLTLTSEGLCEQCCERSK
jgi:hypothetical protein